MTTTPTQSSPAIGDVRFATDAGLDLERTLSKLIAEHVEIGYELGKDGLVDPVTIRVAGTMAAAHMARVACQRALAPTPSPASGERDEALEAIKVISDQIEKVAFSIPPANSYTPQIVSLVISLRRYLISLSSTTAGGKVTGPPDDCPEQLKSAVAKDVF